MSQLICPLCTNLNCETIQRLRTHLHQRHDLTLSTAQHIAQQTQALAAARAELDRVRELWQAADRAHVEMREEFAQMMAERDGTREEVEELKSQITYAGDILKQIAEITSDAGGMFMTSTWEDDWPAALEWMRKHLSMSAEQSAEERMRETINAWRSYVKDLRRERNEAQDQAYTLRKALERYANRTNWSGQFDIACNAWRGGGRGFEVAQKALRKLDGEADKEEAQLPDARTESEQLQQRVARLREALIPYADRCNWFITSESGERQIVWEGVSEDGYAAAEKALRDDDILGMPPPSH